MTLQSVLDVLAQLASIATAIVAIVAYGRFLFDRYRKRLRLERRLKFLKSDCFNEPKEVFKKCSIIDLMAELGMTEAEVMDAAVRSYYIKRLATRAMIGAPAQILLQYYD